LALGADGSPAYVSALIGPDTELDDFPSVWMARALGS